ncbi:uncharacterized protein BCR38DRAFT_480448 [Pseudomassariella vexata]|uniref:Uncharacterized protein n=1 Tax=Pseudomassariella vexata TaxID=1141098 RepID=A0A1Y2EL15_9PEZI|nr:uncharacterized protein BCR38DRAFT_480448 [Pseudomassariella vexata]ORY71974.1 hypothetical protein BCR38DRAFT_480448 [Pseudomassariella vexata]
MSSPSDGSNWTPLYVILALIPLVFLAVVLYSRWQDRRNAATYNLEALERVHRERHWGQHNDIGPPCVPGWFAETAKKKAPNSVNAAATTRVTQQATTRPPVAGPAFR